MKAEREKQRARAEEDKKRRMQASEQRRLDEEARKKEIQDKEAEEKRKKEQADEEEKAERTRITNAKKKRRQRMRQACKEHDLPEDYIEFICARVDLDAMDAFVTQLNALPNEKAPIEKLFKDKIDQLKGKSNAQKAAETQEEGPVHWTTEEVSDLTKVFSFLFADIFLQRQPLLELHLLVI